MAKQPVEGVAGLDTSMGDAVDDDEQIAHGDASSNELRIPVEKGGQ